MHSFFWWTYKYPNFVFYGYNIDTVGKLVSTCLFLMVLSFSVEGLKVLQAKHRQRELALRAKQLRTVCPGEDLSLLPNDRTPKPVTLHQRAFLFIWEFIAWLNLQVANMLLMLSVMGYNGWMFVSVMVGSGIGYFVFGIFLMKINLKNCEIIRGTFCMLGAPSVGESTPILQTNRRVSSTSNEASTSRCLQNHVET